MIKKSVGFIKIIYNMDIVWVRIMEWTSEMTYWNNQKLKAEKKKKEYEEYKKKLENLKGELPNAKDDISLSEKYLLDGGFCFDYGGTLGNEMF